MQKFVLTKDNPISEPFAFEGIINLLLEGGIGEATLERRIGDSKFYPLSTDINGGIANFFLEGECAYNGTFEEKGLETEYRIKAGLDSGELTCYITRAKNVY